MASDYTKYGLSNLDSDRVRTPGTNVTSLVGAVMMTAVIDVHVILCAVVYSAGTLFRHVILDWAQVDV